MMNADKIFLGAVIACSVAVALGTVVLSSNGGGGKAQSAPPPPVETVRPQPEMVTAAPTTPAPAVTHETPAADVVTIAPLPAGATSVPDEDLLKLAAMVDLANARHRPPDKDVWRHVLPVAQELEQGPCDCEQRNWLKHFQEMGNYALTDAGEDYYESAKLMATLGRNDSQAMAISHRPN